MARSKSGDPMRQPVAGWVFVTPMIVILGLFLVVPIGSATMPGSRAARNEPTKTREEETNQRTTG